MYGRMQTAIESLEAYATKLILADDRQIFNGNPVRSLSAREWIIRLLAVRPFDQEPCAKRAFRCALFHLLTSVEATGGAVD